MIYKVSEKEEEIFCAKQTLTHTHTQTQPYKLTLISGDPALFALALCDKLAKQAAGCLKKRMVTCGLNLLTTEVKSARWEAKTCLSSVRKQGKTKEHKSQKGG
jgi:hypothetical protein